MKKNASAIKIIALVLVLLSLSSCNGSLFVSSEYLIRPPRLGGVNGEIEKDFENAMNDVGEYILRYPTSGKYRSSFVVKDCDGDAVPEALVFYSPKQTESEIHVQMLAYKDDSWRPTCDFKGDGTDVYMVEFSDLDNDGIDEIFIGWTVENTKTKKLTIYCSYANSQSLNYQPCFVGDYSELCLLDVDLDSKNEVMLFDIKRTADEYSAGATLYRFEREGLSYKLNELDSVALYDEASSFMKICSDVTSSNFRETETSNEGQADDINSTVRIYIDEQCGNVYLTEILLWNNENDTLKKMFEVDEKNISNAPTARAIGLVCDDSDNTVRVPSTAIVKDSSVIFDDATGNSANVTVTDSADKDVYVTYWSVVEKGKLAIQNSFIENNFDKYKYNLDKNEKIRVNIYPSRHLFQVLNDNGEVLLSIAALDASSVVTDESLLFETENFKYIYSLTDAGKKAGYTRDGLIEKIEVTDSK